MDLINTNKSKKNKVNFFSICYFLYILNQILSQSNYSNYEAFEALFKIIRWGLLIAMFSIIILNKKYPTGRKGLFWGAFAVIGLVEMIVFNGGISLIMLFLVIVAARGRSSLDIINIQIKAMVAGTLFVMISGLIGVIESGVGYKTFDNITGFLFKKSSARYFLGFTNSNVIPLIALYVVLYTVLLKKMTYKRIYDILAIGLNFIIYLICGSRLCIMLVILTVILRNVLYSREEKFINITYVLCYISLVISLLFSVVIPTTALFDNAVIKRINYLSTARLSIMRNLLLRYPINMWGYGDISTLDSNTYSIIDNGYLQLFITRGLIIGIIFIAIVCMMINLAKREKDSYLMLVIFIMIIGNVVDNSLLHYVSVPLYIILFNSKNYALRLKKRKYSLSRGNTKSVIG